MKIYRFCYLFLLLAFINGYTFGYQQEGFLEYYEGDDGIFFECNGVCIIELGEKKETDYLIMDGNIYGSGNVSILSEEGTIWNSLYTDKLSYQEKLGITFSKYEKDLGGAPKYGILSLYFNGDIKGKIKINKIHFSFSQKLSKYWSDFWRMENISYNSVNLRNGVSINGISIVKYGYIVFIIISLCVLIIFAIIKKWEKKRIFKLIFYTGLGLFLFIGIRNTITYIVILNQGLSGYKNNQHFFELDDYIPFVNKIRHKLDLDRFEKNNCKIFIKSNSYYWTVYYHGEYFFKPCERVYSQEMADYIMYYHNKIDVEDLDKKIVVEYNGNYLLDNRTK